MWDAVNVNINNVNNNVNIIVVLCQGGTQHLKTTQVQDQNTYSLYITPIYFSIYTRTWQYRHVYNTEHIHSMLIFQFVDSAAV